MNKVGPVPEGVLLAYTKLEVGKEGGDASVDRAARYLGGTSPSEGRRSTAACTTSPASNGRPVRRTLADNDGRILHGGCSAIQISSKWILAHGALLYPLMKYGRNNYGSKFIFNLDPGKLYSVSKRCFLNDLPLFLYGESSHSSNTDPLPTHLREEANQVQIRALWKCSLLTETLDSYFGPRLLQVPGQPDLNLLAIVLLLERLPEIKDDVGSDLVEHNYQGLRPRARVRARSGSGSEMLMALKELAQSIRVKASRGSIVEIISTPFGNPIFLGTLTRGVIGKVLGKKDCLLLTDANAFPGSEGGPIYLLESGGGKSICGMVIVTSCFWRGERTDYTFAANLPILLEEILQGGNPTLSDLLSASPSQSSSSSSSSSMQNAAQPFLVNDFEKARSHYARWDYGPGTWNARAVLNSSPNRSTLDQSLAVVRCGQTWGTAILMDMITGTLITCAHVVAEAPEWEIRITTYQGNQERTSSARLIYRTAHNEPYDIAVLRVDPLHLDPLLRPIRLAGRRAHKGEDVLAAGYPFSWSSGATISSGVVSKSLDCMLQTSCCVQSGASGGVIVTRASHRMLGMIVCNAVASGGTALYPRLSMAIPLTVLQQPLLRYCQTSDPTILQALGARNLLICKIWKLDPILVPSNI